MAAKEDGRHCATCEATVLEVSEFTPKEAVEELRRAPNQGASACVASGEPVHEEIRSVPNSDSAPSRNELQDTVAGLSFARLNCVHVMCYY